jgi:hypothetical protein
MRGSADGPTAATRGLTAEVVVIAKPRNVDAVAEHIALFDNDVANVDADAELDATVAGKGGVALCHPALHGNRAGDCFDDRPKRKQQAVTDGLDDLPTVRGNERINQLRAVRFQRHISFVIVQTAPECSQMPICSCPNARVHIHSEPTAAALAERPPQPFDKRTRYGRRAAALVAHFQQRLGIIDKSSADPLVLAEIDHAAQTIALAEAAAARALRGDPAVTIDDVVRLQRLGDLLMRRLHISHKPLRRQHSTAPSLDEVLRELNEATP